MLPFYQWGVPILLACGLAWIAADAMLSRKAFWLRWRLRLAVAGCFLAVAPGVTRNTIALVDETPLGLRSEQPSLDVALGRFPPAFRQTLAAVQQQTPADARIRFFAPDNWHRSAGIFALQPREVTAMLYDWPRPDYILIYERDIDPRRLVEEQERLADRPIATYHVVRRWSPRTRLLRREE